MILFDIFKPKTASRHGTPQMPPEQLRKAQESTDGRAIPVKMASLGGATVYTDTDASARYLAATDRAIVATSKPVSRWK